MRIQSARDYKPELTSGDNGIWSTWPWNTIGSIMLRGYVYDTNDVGDPSTTIPDRHELNGWF